MGYIYIVTYISSSPVTIERYSITWICHILFIHTLAKGYWVVSTVRLVWIKQIEDIFLFMSLCGHFSLILGKYKEVELLYFSSFSYILWVWLFSCIMFSFSHFSSFASFQSCIDYCKIYFYVWKTQKFTLTYWNWIVFYSISYKLVVLVTSSVVMCVCFHFNFS